MSDHPNPAPLPPVDDAAILAIERPHRSLWTYYLLGCVAFPPAFPFLVLPAWFRFHTMRYKFSAEGISMSWGILFRREIIIQYARIQDIHLRSNVVERWLGLARVQVQTASGNSAAELTLEGLREYTAVRDFLYERMRGVKTGAQAQAAGAAKPAGERPGAGAGAAGDAELAAVLREVTQELRALRLALESGRKSSGDVDAGPALARAAGERAGGEAETEANAGGAVRVSPLAEGATDV